MVNTLTTAFIADNDTNDVLVSSSPDGLAWANNTQVGQSSRTAPSLAEFNTEFWLAFIADNDTDDVLVCSSADGVQWSANTQTGQSSQDAPSLAVFNNGLWLAFIADNDTRDILICSSPDGQHWSANTRVGQSSQVAPSLAVFNGMLWLAFIADNDTNDVLVCSSPDGRNWSSNTQVRQSSQAAPSLAVFNGMLWLAFIADNDTRDVLVCSSPDGLAWTNNTQVGQSSQDDAPSLAVFNNKLWLAFIADNDTKDVLVCSSPDGLAWTNNTRMGQSSKWAPSLLALVLTVGQVRPLYYLLTVIYAPPGGTNADGAASSVSYLDGSTTGTTTSTSSSFKAGVGVSASISGNQGGVSAGDTADFTASQTTTDSSSLQVQKNVSYSIQVTGPAQDGIDHDYDTFWLWLNPLLNVAIDPYDNLNWELAIDGPTMDIQYVYASWLKDPELMQTEAPGVFAELSARGLTTADFDQILATDPFTSPKPVFDPNRYLPTALSFPYEPPLNPGDTPAAVTYTATSSVTRTATRQVEVQYGVTFTSTASLASDISAALTTQGSLEWTDTSSVETSNESLQTATVIVGGPAYGYSGATNVLVYWDTIFSSFMFAFAENPVASGTVVDGAGEPIAREPITLAVGGHILRTFTDARGEFRFYGAAQGQGKAPVGGNGSTRARRATTRSAATGRARKRPQLPG